MISRGPTHSQRGAIDRLSTSVSSISSTIHQSAPSFGKSALIEYIIHQADHTTRWMLPLTRHSKLAPLNPGHLVIFAALEIESNAIRRVLARSGNTIYTVGLRAKRMPSESQVAGALAIVMAGLAGALDPTLKIGDLVLDDVDHCVPDSINLRRGSILTTDHLVATPFEKSQLFQKTNALAVDMEGSIVREFARRLNIPFFSIRAISDTADDVLDPEVIRFVDEVGRVRPVELAKGLARRPSLIKYLNRLRKNSNLAVDQLGKAVRGIVEAMEENR